MMFVDYFRFVHTVMYWY